LSLTDTWNAVCVPPLIDHAYATGVLPGSATRDGARSWRWQPEWNCWVEVWQTSALTTWLRHLGQGQTRQYRGPKGADQPLSLDAARARNVEFLFGRAGIAQ